MNNKQRQLFTRKILCIIQYPNNSNNLILTMGWDSLCSLLRAAWLAETMTLRNREWIFLIKSDRRDVRTTSQPKVMATQMEAASSQVLEEEGHRLKGHNRNSTDSQWTLKKTIIISIPKGTGRIRTRRRKRKRNWNSRRHKFHLMMTTWKMQRLLS